MSETPTVTCVIAAYNEAARIGGVLAALAGHPLIAETIVIDDGSTDGTAQAAKSVSGVTVIELPENRGKTHAVSVGIETAQTPLLLLLDADLTGLTSAHVSALIEPVRADAADAAISLRGNAPLPWKMIGLDYISGERVLPRAMLAGQLGAIRGLPRFGFEAYLNAHLIRQNARLAIIDWPEVKSPLKMSKRGVWTGLRADAAMMRDIFKTITPRDALTQIVRMRALRIDVAK